MLNTARLFIRSTNQYTPDGRKVLIVCGVIGVDPNNSPFEEETFYQTWIDRTTWVKLDVKNPDQEQELPTGVKWTDLLRLDQILMSKVWQL